MLASVVFFALAASLGVVDALKSSVGSGGIQARHLHLNRAVRKVPRCRKVAKSSASSKQTKSPAANAGNAPKTTTSAAKSQVTGSSGNTAETVQASGCGGPGAQPTPGKDAGPNGAEWWLNCGVDSNGGWHPPTITADQVISKKLDDVIDGSVFSPCKAHLQYFNQYGKQYNIPPIMLASFALQESSCNANIKGGDGIGLMQITSDKCGGAPGGNCADPSFNIKTGAAYFRTVVDSHNGNLVQSVGEYNGWDIGMTVAKAKEMPGGCVTQRNLDYLHQLFNGWLQGVDGSEMGTYNNLANC